MQQRRRAARHIVHCVGWRAPLMFRMQRASLMVACSVARGTRHTQLDRGAIAYYAAWDTCSPRGVGPQDALVRGVHAALQMKYLVHLSTRLAEIVASAEDKIDAIRAGSDAASTSGGTERPTQGAGGELAAALLLVAPPRSIKTN